MSGEVIVNVLEPPEAKNATPLLLEITDPLARLTFCPKTARGLLLAAVVTAAAILTVSPIKVTEPLTPALINQLHLPTRHKGACKQLHY
jgi:hypothetical protein